jgi:hypothetical protein
VSSDRRSQGGGVSITTLLIAGASSAAAAFIVQTFWQTGTVFAAAMTPVIVALVSETLKKPVEVVSAVRVRRTPAGTALLDPVEPEPDPDEPFDPLAPLPTEELEAALTDAPRPQRTQHRRRRLTARQWKIGIATGLIAFFCAAAVVTASELAIFGDSVSSGDRRTTFFGGSHSSSSSSSDQDKEEATPTATETAEPKESATPTTTPTATATATATPTQTVAPQGAAPTVTATAAPSATATP